MEVYFIIIVIAVFLALLFLIYSSTFFNTGTKLDKFVLRLPIASQFLIGFGIIVTFLIFVTNYQDSVRKSTTDTIRETYDKTLEVFDTHSKRCPNLIASFFYPWQKIEHKNKHHNTSLKNVEDEDISVIYVSNHVFQIIEFYVQQSSKLDATNTRFLAFFSSLCYSKILKEEWEDYRAFFGLTTKLIIEDLFKINETQTFNNSDELINYFDIYTHSERFKKIMKTVEVSSTRSILF